MQGKEQREQRGGGGGCCRAVLLRGGEKEASNKSGLSVEGAAAQSQPCSLLPMGSKKCRKGVGGGGGVERKTISTADDHIHRARYSRQTGQYLNQ